LAFGKIKNGILTQYRAKAEGPVVDLGPIVEMIIERLKF
jgi:hypothetical protein